MFPWLHLPPHFDSVQHRKQLIARQTLRTFHVPTAATERKKLCLAIDYILLYFFHINTCRFSRFIVGNE